MRVIDPIDKNPWISNVMFEFMAFVIGKPVTFAKERMSGEFVCLRPQTALSA